jgi:hypothetical protein
MFCRSLLTIILTALHASSSVAASTGGPAGCVTFDVNWNLLAFGFNGKDYNGGTQDTWSSSTGSLKDITANGRPPFDSVNTTCYLSQFANAIYVLNADTANPSSVYIYDATALSWSTQKVVTNTFDPSNFAAILDHDTNVFYAYSNAELFSLDMGLLKAANSTPIPWLAIQSPDLSNGNSGTITPGANTNGYQPTMALAQNHVFFMGVSGLPAGSVKIFVIHFSYLQPAPQSMGKFPTTHGKTASFFQDSGVQQEFAFIPDDGSTTYVVNVETNTTKTLTGPPQQDSFATYSASTSALVQLTTGGKVSFLAYNETTTTSGGTWNTITKIPVAVFSTSGNSSGNASSSASGATPTSTGSSTSGSNGTSKSGSSSIIRAAGSGSDMMLKVVGMVLAVLLGSVALVL